MKTVFKYPLELTENVFDVLMPAFAEALHFGFQGNQLCLWALVDPEKDLVRHRFVVVGTGQPAEEIGPYINTVLSEKGVIVLHFFHWSN